ncbi:MAG: putative glycoside hydrolase [Patescibacteria group bacterium]
MSGYATPFLTVAAIFTALSFFPVSLFDVYANKRVPEAQPVSSVDDASSELKNIEPDTRPIVKHVPLPKQVKTIYMTSCVAGTTDFRDRLIKLIDETEVNSVIIDIKDFSGTISFPSEQDTWKSAWAEARCGTPRMRELIELLHSKNIYTIARLTVFQDPFYAPKHPEQAVLRNDGVTVWTDHKGLSFVDVAAKQYWDHMIDLSAEVYNLGFDELNFDYVRYPSDGNMSDTYYPQSMAGQYKLDKQANLEAFFKYLNEKLDEESRFATYRHENTGRASSTPYTSVDLFGMTTTNFNDLSIGQVQDRAAPYFDFLAPMVYPSHYPPSFLNLGNPNDYPYKVVYYAMKTGVDRMKAPTTPMEGFLHQRVGTSTPAVYVKPGYGAEKFRTWIQDFDYGGDYDAADVRAQIQASYDAGVNSWMIWAPSNSYTREALQVD